MVEANPNGVVYGKFRTDKEPDEGYTADLVHHQVDPKYYDDFNSLPQLQGQPRTITSLFLQKVQEHPEYPFLGQRAKNADGTYGEYEWLSYGDVKQRHDEIAKGIVELGLLNVIDGINEDGKEWRITGIWSKNRWEWHTTLLAAMTLRGSVVGFYDSMGESAVEYCLKQTRMQTMYVSAAYLKTIVNMRKNSMGASLQNVVMFDTDADTEQLTQEAKALGISVYTLDEVRERGRNSQVVLRPEDVQPDDIYILNYTSGTTGDSKGVKISHWGVLGGVYLFKNQFGFNSDDCAIDYLPAPHVFDQYIFTTMIAASGKNGYYQGDPLKLTEDCQVLKPTLFPSVPRLYNKIYSKIKATLDANTGCKKWLIDWGMGSKMNNLKSSATYTHGCFDKLVFKKTAGILGGRVRYLVTAAAPISADVLEFCKVVFCAPIMEGYGLSETSGAITITSPNDPVSGVVGGLVENAAIRLKDLPELDYRITDNPPRGEICIRGPAITPGYFSRPDKTAEAIDDQGYLHTGDVGVIFPNGALKIIDRCKNIFKLQQGEYVAPEKVENIYIQSSCIAQCMVYGNSFRNYCVAIIVVEPDPLAKWAAANGKTPEQVCSTQDEDYKAVIMEEINSLAKQRNLISLEKPKEIFITLEPFSVENDILTPTFKLKRNVGQRIYQAQIDKMYEALAARGL